MSKSNQEMGDAPWSTVGGGLVSLVSVSAGFALGFLVFFGCELCVGERFRWRELLGGCEMPLSVADGVLSIMKRGWFRFINEDF